VFPHWQFDRDQVSNLHVAALDDNRHDASLADEVTVRVPAEHCRCQPPLERFNLPARIAQTDELDHRLGSELQSRALWQCQKIDAARRHILADGAGPNVESASAQLVEQFFMHEMHLPQVRRVGIFRGVITVLDFLAHMRVAFDAEARNKTDHQLIPLAERVALAAAHGGDDSGHRFFSISRA
jgi:hypothetical protein